MNNLTRQNTLWPQEENHSFTISNKILADCIGIGSGASRGISGFNYGKGLGSALLSYFTAQALSFSRLPFCEDRIYSHYMTHRNNFDDEVLSEIDIEAVKEITDELRQLYEHTQNKLKEAKLSKVRLKRNIHLSGSNINGYANNEANYAAGIIELVEASKKLGQSTVKIEMDTLNSYTDSQGDYSHLGDVVIETEIDAEDILYCSNLVDQNGVTKLVESAEWVVVNKSPTGVIELPIEAISYDQVNIQFKGEMTQKRAESFLERHIPFVLRGIDPFPPSYGDYGRVHTWKKKISKWLMRDNVAGF